MTLYEVGLIIDPEVSPEEEKAILDRLENVIADAGGSVTEKDPWGRRELAYPIKKKTHGIYHFWKYELDPAQVDKVHFTLRTDDRILRYLILNMDRELRRVRKRQRMEAASSPAAEESQQEQ